MAMRVAHMRWGIAARACTAGLRRPRRGPRGRRQMIAAGEAPATQGVEGNVAPRVCAGALRQGTSTTARGQPLRRTPTLGTAQAPVEEHAPALSA
eukprot:2781906-Alexandrium_andersonii.AAC.1